MSRRYRGGRSEQDNALGCVVTVMLCIFAMPIMGLIMALGKDPSKHALGWVLTILGIILWILIL